ncbi:hypothetical protein KKF61_08840 [Patescibacteria group bacterium]|nr:hypothetical protein [Patescibacteria group bacterium]
MADEIRLSYSLHVVNGFFSLGPQSVSLQIDQAAIGRAGHAQSIGFAAAEIVDFGDIATNGYLVMRNLDDTNYVTWGPDNGVAGIQVMGKLKPGEVAIFRVAPTIVMYAQADTAAVLLDVYLLED